MDFWLMMLGTKLGSAVINAPLFELAFTILLPTYFSKYSIKRVFAWIIILWPFMPPSGG